MKPRTFQRVASMREFRRREQIRNRKKFRELVAASELLTEMGLWGMEHLPYAPRAADDAEDSCETAVRSVVVRLFDDFEASRLLIVCGLPDASAPHERDAIECLMLLRLFAADRDKAVSWLTDLKQYSPGIINQRLEELGIVALEYGWYSWLSDRTHPNLMAMLAPVEEKELEPGKVNVEWGVGGRHNPRFIKNALMNLVGLQMLALYGGLTRLYEGYLGSDQYSWYRILDNVSNLAKRLEIELSDDTGDAATESTSGTRRIDLKVKVMEERIARAFERMEKAD